MVTFNSKICVLDGADNWGYIDDVENGEGMLHSPLINETEIVVSTVFYQWFVKPLFQMI